MFLKLTSVHDFEYIVLKLETTYDDLLSRSAPKEVFWVLVKHKTGSNRYIQAIVYTSCNPIITGREQKWLITMLLLIGHYVSLYGFIEQQFLTWGYGDKFNNPYLANPKLVITEAKLYGVYK